MQGVYRKYYRLDSSTHNKNKSRRIRFSLLNWDPILGPNTEDNQTAEVEEEKKKRGGKKKKKGEKFAYPTWCKRYSVQLELSLQLTALCRNWGRATFSPCKFLKPPLILCVVLTDIFFFSSSSFPFLLLVIFVSFL